MANSNPVTKLKIKNYKAFRHEHTIELNNLTLLFGYNNTGKSALVRALPLLRDSMKEQQPKYFTTSYLDYGSASIRGGLFKDITTVGENRLGFGLQWENGDGLEFELMQEGSEPETMTSLKLICNGETSYYQPSLDVDRVLENTLDNRETLTFDNFRAEPSIELNHHLDTFSKSVHWISSTRIPPEREFDIGVGVPLQIKPNGAGVGPMIWHLNDIESPSIPQINNWLSKTCNREIFFGALTREASSSDGRLRVGLNTIAKADTSESRHKVAILDSGEGIAQALPVVVLAAMAANGELGEYPIIAIEQPELHLHPQASVELANFIIDCIQRNQNIRFILETHSESFLRALQIAILATDLHPENFSCYWTSMENDGSTLEKIEFDEDAHLSNSWPQEVFRESLNQAKELVKLRKEKIG
ncbi:ATP-binding protein [Vibrio alginolyticus]